jgi:hypothetical protein
VDGLAEFQKFYQPQGTVSDFLDRPEEEQLKKREEMRAQGNRMLD